MATRAAVQTPGEAPASNPAPEAQTASAAPATVEELQAALAAQQAQMAQMMAAMQQLQANQRVVPAAAQAESLPDSDSLDMAEINAGSTPVLTKQGWIVPPTYGADPVALAEKKAEAQKNAAIVKLAEVAAAKA